MPTIYLKQSFPFASVPHSVSIDDDKIYLNNVTFPKSIDTDAAYNPHNVRAWVIGKGYGALCMVWASHEQEAFDCAVDLGALDSLSASEQGYDVENYDDESLTTLGNAGELFDLSYAWIGEVEWDAARDIQTIVRIIRAVENQQDTLES